MIFNFKVKEQTLFKIKDKNRDNLSYFKCKFYFDNSNWDNEDIFVKFTNNEGFSKSLFLGKYEEILSCSVPKHIMNNNSFRIFLYSKNFKTNELSVYLLNQKENIVKRDQVIENILQQIDTKIDNIQFENNKIKFYSNNNLIDSIYLDNVDENIIKTKVQEYLTENPKIDNITFIDNNIVCYGNNEVICTIPFLLADIAWSGDYNDLNNIPKSFNPSQHTHQMVDVTDYENNVSMDLNILLDSLSDEISKE